MNDFHVLIHVLLLSFVTGKESLIESFQRVQLLGSGWLLDPWIGSTASC